MLLVVDVAESQAVVEQLGRGEFHERLPARTSLASVPDCHRPEVTLPDITGIQ